MIQFVMFLAFVFGGLAMIGAVVDGEGSGFAASPLSADVDADDLYLPISSASGFPASAGRMFIQSEQFSYSSIQTSANSNCPSPPCLVATRGINGSDEDAHDAGVMVYTENAGLINATIGFRIARFATVSNPIEAISVTLDVARGTVIFFAKVVLLDFSFFEGNAIYLRLILMGMLGLAVVVGLIRLVRGSG